MPFHGYGFSQDGNDSSGGSGTNIPRSQTPSNGSATLSASKGIDLSKTFTKTNHGTFSWPPQKSSASQPNSLSLQENIAPASTSIKSASSGASQPETSEQASSRSIQPKDFPEIEDENEKQ